MIDLAKRAQTLSLDKVPEVEKIFYKAAPIVQAAGLGDTVARVALILDASASMKKLYESGKVQHLVNRIAALAALFDVDGKLDVFPFHTRAFTRGNIPPMEVVTVVEKIIQETGYGATSYARALNAVLEYYWPAAKHERKPVIDEEPPVFVVFVTDGIPNDRTDAEFMLRVCSFRPMFTVFVALGEDYDSNAQIAPRDRSMFGFTRRNLAGAEPRSEAMRYLLSLDDALKGTHVDAIDMFGSKEPDSLSDEEFMRRLVGGEFCQWLDYPKVRAMRGLG